MQTDLCSDHDLHHIADKSDIRISESPRMYKLPPSLLLLQVDAVQMNTKIAKVHGLEETGLPAGKNSACNRIISLYEVYTR